MIDAHAATLIEGAPPDSVVHARLRALELENAELERCRSDLEALVAAQASELRQARALAESARAAKRTFLSNLSHEVRTPLNVILGLTHVLEVTLENPAARDRLVLIREAGHQLLNLFEDMIDLTRGESEVRDCLASAFDPEDLLDEVRAETAERVMQRGLAFSADWAWLPPRLIGDPERVQRVLGIYLDNALKFTERGAIRLSAAVVGETTREVLVRFAVADTGSGIPPDLLPRLFEVFEPGDTSTTRRHRGSGVGLALARSLARRMGGDAGFEPNPGGGSTFWFTVRLGVPGGEPTAPEVLLRDLRNRAAGSDGPP